MNAYKYNADNKSTDLDWQLPSQTILSNKI